MKKRFLAIILIIATLLQLGSLSGCKQDTSSDDPSQKTMTRGEWIALLGQTMGMSDYQSDESYYQDISSDSDIYPYVQSCYEWGVLAEGETFNADDVATPAFVAATAALATGTVPEELLGDEDAIQDYAQKQGLLPDGRKRVSLEDGLAMAETAQHIYMDDRHENIEDVVWAEGVVDMSESPNIFVEGSQLIIPNEEAESLTVGSVFTISEGGTLVARKVTALNTERGQTFVQTEEPDLGEVFDEVTLYDYSTPTFSGATLAEGVSLGAAANPMVAMNGMEGIYIDDLVNRGTEHNVADSTDSKSFTFTINFTKGEASLSADGDMEHLSLSGLMPAFPVDTVIGATPEEQLGQIFEKNNFLGAIPITKDELKLINEDGWERSISVNNEFEGGYEITGSITIKDFDVETGFEFKKIFGIPTGIKRLVVETGATFSTDLTMKGTLSEELSFATLPIKLGGIGTLDVELILYVDASGELKVKAEITKSVKAEYSDGNIKKTAQSNQSVSGEAAIDAEAGPKLKFTLKIVGIKIIDVAISVGVSFEFEAKEKISYIENRGLSGDTKNKKVQLWTYSIVFESHVRLPIIKLKIGHDKNTLANKLNITYSCDLISKEEAPIDWRPSLLNIEIPIWKYSETEELDNEETENEERKFDLGVYSLILNGGPQRIELEGIDGKKAPKVIWSSENPSVATVDDSGLVTPVSSGITVISVADKKDPSIVVKCTVIVQEIGENDWEFLPADMSMSWT